MFTPASVASMAHTHLDGVICRELFCLILTYVLGKQICTRTKNYYHFIDRLFIDAVCTEQVI